MAEQKNITCSYCGNACDSRRWEFDTQNAQLIMHGVRPDIVFIGDSITHIMEPMAYFHDLGLTVNRGIGGDITSGVLHRLEADLLQHKPKAAALLIGINDLCADLHKAVMLGGDKEMLEWVAGNTEQIISRTTQAGIPIAVGSILPTRLSYDSRHAERAALIKGINERVSAFCKATEGAEFVDYWPVMVQEDGITLRTDVSDDGLHPNATGYDNMFGVLHPVLEKMVK